MQTIRAKFRCQSVDRQYEGQEYVHLEAVTDGSEENKSFSEYTPSGQHNMCITNKAAHGFFQEGQDYYLDFTPAE